MKKYVRESKFMKRICTDREKEIVKNNKLDIISDTISEKTSKTVMAYVIGLVFGFLIAVPIAIAIKSTDTNLIEFIIIMILSASIGFTHFLIKGKAGSRLGKKSLDGNIYINGATIIGINPEQKFIIFVEDDLKDYHGRPYRISVPAKNFEGISPGDRIIVVYVDNGPYYVMKLNEHTRVLISSYSSFDFNYISYNNCWYPTILPHPNAIYTDVMPRDMSQEEKTEFVNTFYNYKTKSIKATFVGVSIVMLILCALIVLVMYLSKELSVEYFIVIASIYIGFIMFFGLVILFIKNSTLNNLNKVNQLRRVIMNSNNIVYIGYLPQQNMSIYYNAIDKFNTFNMSYPQMTEKFYYGDVLYMYQRGEQNYFIKAKCF